MGAGEGAESRERASVRGEGERGRPRSRREDQMMREGERGQGREEK